MDTALEQRIRNVLRKIDGVLESPGTFHEDDGFWVNGKEIAHFHGQDLELRLTRKLISANRERLRADSRIERRRPSSDWITIHCATQKDIAVVAELAETAAAAHRPRPGVPPELPPTGAALQRRRRFH